MVDDSISGWSRMGVRICLMRCWTVPVGIRIISSEARIRLSKNQLFNWKDLVYKHKFPLQTSFIWPGWGVWATMTPVNHVSPRRVKTMSIGGIKENFWSYNVMCHKWFFPTARILNEGNGSHGWSKIVDLDQLSPWCSYLNPRIFPQLKITMSDLIGMHAMNAPMSWTIWKRSSSSDLPNRQWFATANEKFLWLGVSQGGRTRESSPM